VRIADIVVRLGRAVAVAVTVLAAACGVETDSSTGSDTGGPSGVDVAAMSEDERTAIQTTEAYWRRHFSELFGRQYHSPRVAGGYRGQNGPRCAGESAVQFNAFYCPAGDFLAWDEDLMAAGYERIGDAWVYLIIAHEWGHAVQAQLGSDQVSVAAELQADCLAGAALQGAAEDGLLTIESGDSEEIAKTLAAVADDFPWTKESDHGDAQQRIAAFNKGAQDGAKACV
jgi:predicted metalloprotease